MLKISWKVIFCESLINSFQSKRTFMQKAVLHITNLMHCKARKVLRNLFSTNQRNVLERAFVARSY